MKEDTPLGRIPTMVEIVPGAGMVVLGLATLDSRRTGLAELLLGALLLTFGGAILWLLIRDAGKYRDSLKE